MKFVLSLEHTNFFVIWRRCGEWKYFSKISLVCFFLCIEGEQEDLANESLFFFRITIIKWHFFLVVLKVNREDLDNGKKGNQYSITLDGEVKQHDTRALMKACETLAFLVRDAAHVTPHNFESCVHAIRTFVEASVHGGNCHVPFLGHAAENGAAFVSHPATVIIVVNFRSPLPEHLRKNYHPSTSEAAYFSQLSWL